ncbi:MAG: hypothetical protein ABSF28_01700 [Terracidiphilus sp.]|jgi:hypothetical protein
MTALTDDEVREFIAKNEWSTGIKTDGRSLHYDDPESNALYLKFPETPLRATYLSRVASMLGIDDEAMFYGALLWITLSVIGSPQLEKTGWTMMEMMRRGFGENRPLEAASGHWFRNGAVVELAAFVLPCFVFGWDAYIVPSGGNLFAHISHDEYWAVVARDARTYDAALGALKEISPQEGHQGLLRQFCPLSRHIHSD